jgi:hypothetical protein
MVNQKQHFIIPFESFSYPLYFECILSSMNGFNSQIGQNNAKVNLYVYIQIHICHHFKLVFKKFNQIFVFKNIKPKIKMNFSIFKFSK